MKKINYIFLFVIFFGCSSVIVTPKLNYNILNCRVIEMKEYQDVFGFKALNEEQDTILIISLKENYHNEYFSDSNIVLNELESIQLNGVYDFYVMQKKPTVATMEQLGAFIIMENDTLCKSFTYKGLPKSFVSSNTIGTYYLKLSSPK